MPAKPYTLPDRETLEATVPAYAPQDIDTLVEARELLNRIKDDEDRRVMGDTLLRRIWPDEPSFIANTHWIRQKGGTRLTRMVWKKEQRRLYDKIREFELADQPVRILILKARQIGYSTFTQSWHYERCTRLENRVALTLSHDSTATTELFQKAKLIHSKMWFGLPVSRSRSDGMLDFDAHGSVFMANTAGNTNVGRGNTFQHLHCSEVPMWRDVSTVFDSVLQAVPELPGTSVIVESTARGAEGDFYEMWMASEKGENEYYPFFSPWWQEEEYQLAFHDAAARSRFLRTMGKEDKELMAGFELSAEQMNWRQHTIRNRLRGSVRRFRQEYPSFAEEAFLASGFPAFNQDMVRDLRHQATDPLWRGNIILSR